VSESTTRCDPRKVRVGSVYSRHSFGEVVDVNGYLNRATLRNKDGLQWDIGLDILAREYSMADQSEREETINRTKILEILRDNPRTAMTVHFNKAVDLKEVASALAEGQGKASDKAWREKVEQAMAGEERVMIGHHTNAYDERGRLHFDEHGKGPRLVDPRTVNWLIVGRTKYTVKD
jgi:hypothetical protein